MVDVIFCGLDGFACENIPDLLTIQDSLPEFTNLPKLSHFFIHRCQLVDQPRDFRIVVLQPLHLFILDPAQDGYGIVLDHPDPVRVEAHFLFQFAARAECVGERGNLLIESLYVCGHTADGIPVHDLSGVHEKTGKCPVGNHVCELFLWFFQLPVKLPDLVFDLHS